MSLLEIRDVSYGYSSKAESREVLKHVSCSFDVGKFYAIIGKSGSGKSTLLSLMAGLDLPQSGQILYEGRPTSKMDLDEYRKQYAAVVYQDFSLFPLLTALENIMYPMELCHVEKQKERKEAERLAALVSLPEELTNRYPGRISGGEQQRVAIARALTMDRKLMLADEPTGNLDSGNSDNIISLLMQLAHEQSKCVIVVTHDITIMQKADEVYMIDGGLRKVEATVK